MDRLHVAIVVPALDEAATIAEVVRNVSTYGVPIVVDDGSSDGTGHLAREAGADVVRHADSRGYESALESGFARAAQIGCGCVVTIDADGQHSPEQLEEFLARIDAGDDLVIGSRDRLQRFAEVVFAWTAQRLWRVSDPLCGMKAYRIELYHRLGHFDDMRSVGTELAIRAVVSRCRYSQLPVRTRDRNGQPRFARTLQANLRILRALAVLVRLHLTMRLRLPPAVAGARASQRGTL